MKQGIAFTAITALGAILGWLCAVLASPEPTPLAKPDQNQPPTSLLGPRNTDWLDQWEQELATGTTTHGKLPFGNWAMDWDEERKRFASLAHKNPEAAIAWIRENVSEHEQDQRIRTQVIHPLMAADFRKAVDLLPALELDDVDTSPHSRSLFWLFQYVPVVQLPELASYLISLKDDDVLYDRALPDLVKEWARRDFGAAATWLDSGDGEGEPIHADLTAIIEAARVQEGSIPHGLEDFLGDASDRILAGILKDLYDASLRLPGDPGEHAQKVLALTPPSQQQRYASSFVSSWAMATPEAASDWALSFEDSALATDLLSHSMTHFSNYVPDQVDAWQQAQAPEHQALIAEARALAEERLKRLPPP